MKTGGIVNIISFVNLFCKEVFTDYLKKKCFLDLVFELMTFDSQFGARVDARVAYPLVVDMVITLVFYV